MAKGPEVDDVHSTCRRYVCSYPKAGRTWLRFMLATALCAQNGVASSLDLHSVYGVVPNAHDDVDRGWGRFEFAGRLPLVGCAHGDFDPGRFAQARIVYLARDPRDMVVSLYLHRTHQHGERLGSLQSFIRGVDGVRSQVRHFESWAPVVARDDALLVTYERLRGAPTAVLSEVANWLDLRFSDSTIREAVTAGSFDRMQEREIAVGISGHSHDRTDPEARRVRRGVVGGHVDYLTAADCSYVCDVLRSSSDAVRDLLRTIPTLADAV